MSANRQANAILNMALIFNPDSHDKSLFRATILSYFDAEQLHPEYRHRARIEGS